MSPKSKQEYLTEVKPRYQKAALRKKTRILDEFCQTYHCHRKHAIRTLNKPLVPVSKPYNKRGRKPIYENTSLETVLKRIWLNSNLPCSSCRVTFNYETTGNRAKYYNRIFLKLISLFYHMP